MRSAYGATLSLLEDIRCTAIRCRSSEYCQQQFWSSSARVSHAPPQAPDQSRPRLPDQPTLILQLLHRIQHPPTPLRQRSLLRSPPLRPTSEPAPTNSPIPPTETPSPTNTPAPTFTPRPTPTLKPSPTPVPTVRPTPTPRPTSTPRPPNPFAGLQNDRWIHDNHPRLADAVRGLLWVSNGVSELETEMLQELLWIAWVNDAHAWNLVQAPWVVDGPNQAEIDAIGFLNWASQDSPAFGNQIWHKQWFQDDITPDELTAIDYIYWSYRAHPSLAQKHAQ